MQGELLSALSMGRFRMQELYLLHFTSRWSISWCPHQNMMQCEPSIAHSTVNESSSSAQNPSRLSHRDWATGTSFAGTDSTANASTLRKLGVKCDQQPAERNSPKRPLVKLHGWDFDLSHAPSVCL